MLKKASDPKGHGPDALPYLQLGGEQKIEPGDRQNKTLPSTDLNAPKLLY